MNHKRGVLALIAAFIFIFLFDFVWHGILMKPAYMETPEHWRPPAELQTHFGFLLLGQAVIAFAFTGLYVSKVGRQSAATGLGYGIVIGILLAGGGLVRFAAEPLTPTVLGMWMVGGLIEFGAVGALVGAIYKPLAGPPSGQA